MKNPDLITADVDFAPLVEKEAVELRSEEEILCTPKQLEAEMMCRYLTPSDINEHLCALSVLASQCRHVVEFGVRSGNSTVALLHGLTGFKDHQGFYATELISYDINPPEGIFGKDVQDGSSFSILGAAHTGLGTIWTFFQRDTASPDLQIYPHSGDGRVDMLFIDTLHTDEQVRAELRHADNVNKYIVLHDTVLFGQRGEQSQPGIMPAIRDFLSTHKEWGESIHHKHNNGLLVLERLG